jgi:hypothetical protein
MAQEILSIIFTGIIFLIVLVSLIFAVFWLLGKFGLWKLATYRRLKKKFRNLEFDENKIAWVNNALEKKWKYKDVLRFIKYERDGSELLYTFLVMEKLKKAEKEVKL